MPALEFSLLLHRALEARVGVLTALLERPGWMEDPEALHQLRVASRRTRAALDLAAPELYPRHRAHRRRLRRLTRALGLTRELDVHAAYLEDLARRVPGMATGAALEHAQELLEVRRAKARRTMARRLAGHPCRKLPELLRVPSFPDPFRPGDPAAETWAVLEPQVDAAFAPIPGLLGQEDAGALHRLRIRMKRLRYALEVLAEAFQAPPEASLAGLKELQTALGEHHDRAMLEAFLQELWQGLSGRGRAHLAGGALELLSYVGEDRLRAFERFRRAAQALPERDLRGALCAGLGLAEEAPE